MNIDDLSKISTKELFLELLKRKDIFSARGFYGTSDMGSDSYQLETDFHLTKDEWDEHLIDDMEKGIVKSITVTSDEESISINLPIDLLIYAQAWRDSPFRITDKEAMVKWIVKNIITYSRRDEGISDFEMFLDMLFDEAIESGELWLEQEFGQDG